MSTDISGIRRNSECPVTHRLREIDPANQQDIAAITRLHLQLLAHGPMARLGELFLQRFCYTMLIRDGLMKAALYEVDGRPAGFIAYTTRSISFHRTAIRRHWLYVAGLILVSLLRDPRLLLRLLKGVRLMFSRRAERRLGQDPMAEVLAIGVLPEYRTPEFLRRTGLRLGAGLVAHATSYFQQAGLTRMRMVVEARNKPALVFYHSLGASFEPCRHAGEPMVQVSFDLNGQPASSGSTLGQTEDPNAD